MDASIPLEEASKKPLICLVILLGTTGRIVGGKSRERLLAYLSGKVPGFRLVKFFQGSSMDWNGGTSGGCFVSSKITDCPSGVLTILLSWDQVTKVIFQKLRPSDGTCRGLSMTLDDSRCENSYASG
ncbi:hypothetical protein CC86DRAFT_5794 [Ophiobolus disseminans]|uniref:Uncharacterized protein n=1 Tax=Ophiobolus disseminans TaxID=1469910 RepID=A0A6A7AKB0_9PLEO|nr:hypothetical protein CC86DRAFT_5794 [Ophiobolus disseminans]